MSLFGRDHNIFAIDIICINTYMQCTQHIDKYIYVYQTYHRWKVHFHILCCFVIHCGKKTQHLIHKNYPITQFHFQNGCFFISDSYSTCTLTISFMFNMKYSIWCYTKYLFKKDSINLSYVKNLNEMYKNKTIKKIDYSYLYVMIMMQSNAKRLASWTYIARTGSKAKKYCVSSQK